MLSKQKDKAITIIASLAFLVTPSRLVARTPAAIAIELVAKKAADSIPASCSHVSFSRGSLSHEPFSTGRRGGFRLVNLDHPEEVEWVLLLRDEESCSLWMGRGSIPVVEATRTIFERRRPLSGIELAGGDKLRLRVGKRQVLLKPAESYCAVRKGGFCNLAVVHYGRLELYRRTESKAPEPAALGEAKSGTFYGPGDRREYSLSIPGPGTLVIEYRLEAGPGLADMRITSTDGKVLGSGSATFERASKAIVSFEYRGSSSSAFDIGFLFTPDIPVSCRLEVRRRSDGGTNVRVEFTNMTGRQLLLPPPGPATVEIRAGGKLVSAARPASGTTLAAWPPGGRKVVEVELGPIPKSRKIEARYSIPGPYTVSCSSAAGGPGPNALR